MAAIVKLNCVGTCILELWEFMYTLSIGILVYLGMSDMSDSISTEDALKEPCDSAPSGMPQRRFSSETAPPRSTDLKDDAFPWMYIVAPTEPDTQTL